MGVGEIVGDAVGSGVAVGLGEAPPPVTRDPIGLVGPAAFCGSENGLRRWVPGFDPPIVTIVAMMPSATRAAAAPA